MMSSTHAAIGVSLAALLGTVAPDLAMVAAVAAFAGGVFPDLDVVLEHRKTLHFPEHYWLLALPAIALATARPGPRTVAVAAFLASAGLHSVTDVFGGGLGLRPWENDDQRGVYSHWRGRWLPPRRWVRYDGAPEDLLTAAVFTLPPLAVFDGTVRRLVLTSLVASVAYTAVRKRLPDVYERIV